MIGEIQDSVYQIVDILNRADQLTIIDNADANVTYYGTAPWGTLTSDAKWVIFKTTMNCTVTTVGGVNTISAVGLGTSTITQRASGRSNSIWDSRTSLTYNTTA